MSAAVRTSVARGSRLGSKELGNNRSGTGFPMQPQGLGIVGNVSIDHGVDLGFFIKMWGGVSDEDYVGIKDF